MFSLIITIISIALVAALAVASVYYGGAAFSQGSAKASASTLVNAAQQIAGANTLYANDNGGTFATDIGALTPTYLSAVPSVKAELADPDTTQPGWRISGNNVVTFDLNDNATEVADQIRLQAGQTVVDAQDADAAGTQFGVYNDATEGLVFFYKG